MNKDEAKYLLQSYRPSGKDANDPHFEEALALAQSDPEMQGWFARQQGITQAISDKLHEIEVPKDLKARILSGKIEQDNPRQWTFGHTLAAAAIILILLTPVAWYANQFQPTGPKTYAAMKLDMGNYLSRFFVLEKQSDSVDEMRTYLSSEHGFTDFKVPETLSQYPGIGCQMIDWHNEPIALICFVVDNEVVHLFMMDSDAFEDEPTSLIPEFEQINEWATYTWSEAPRSYLVSTLGDEEFLTRVLKPKRPF